MAMVNDMNAKVRLQALEAQLRERGVVDVKFFFNRSNKALSGVMADVANALDAVVSGRFDNAKPLGDSVRAV